MPEATISSTRRLTSKLLAVVLAMIATMLACGGDRVRGPMDYVHDCRPGASPYRCIQLLSKAKHAYEGGHLLSIQVDVSAIVKGERNGRPIIDRDRVLAHKLFFEYGLADVLDVLRAELGEPDGYGELHLLRAALDESYRTGKVSVPKGGMPIELWGVTIPDGPFWKTEDGYWMCDDNPALDFKSVTWISNPFQVDDKDKDIDVYQRDVDRYVPKAPKAAAIWDRLGRTLIGEDLASRPK